MKRKNLDNLPSLVIPEGCDIRTYQPGDEQAWADIMNTGIENDWTAAKVVAELTGTPQFDPEGLFFVTIKGKPVGSACAWRLWEDETEEGVVHMVCVLPEARGKNLGYTVTLRVLHHLRERGFKWAVLTTDDFRIPAIKAYLRLGFEPLYADETHEQRWEEVLKKIGDG
jgi:mycothiol synthase